MQEDVIRFVHDSLRSGQSRSRIQEELEHAGWDNAEIQAALASFSETDFPVPVPRPRPYLSAADAFSYLVVFATLYVSAFSFGSLLFQFVDLLFPDTTTLSVEQTRGAMRMSISSLIVAYPIFLAVTVRIRRKLCAQPFLRSSKVRKWLTYLTLFAAAAVVLGDLIALVYSLLGGQLPAQFLLQVGIIMAIAGVVFGYYLWEMREDERVLQGTGPSTAEARGEGEEA